MKLLYIYEQQILQQDFNILKSSNKINLLQFYELDNGVTIKTCLTIDHHLEPSIHVHGRNLPPDHEAYAVCCLLSCCLDRPNKANKQFLCIGNPDQESVHLFDPTKSKKAYLKTHMMDTSNKTIRSVSCPLLSKRMDVEHIVQPFVVK